MSLPLYGFCDRGDIITPPLPGTVIVKLACKSGVPVSLSYSEKILLVLDATHEKMSKPKLMLFIVGKKAKTVVVTRCAAGPS